MHRLKTNSKVIGMKQTLKALENDEVEVLYVAKDAQDKVTTRLIELAGSQQIPVVYIDTMEELGSVCDVEVKTATAALIK
ncbi:ribosomal L7Ae/L30e/S12e/Gadd45 family protein [Vallitalea guaymasensis]|uniref:ribosomal L7Ae/L30e/S12e/Gadd45 family protein n=1 Tax=Vallitalea guaymasensis TaxID=1185412 RepID=UPI002E8E0D5C|nr:ribosomal L7Ae/L30e/S12e/Gadd45 family protein [Vallitalea guaymasensis]